MTSFGTVPVGTPISINSATSTGLFPILADAGSYAVIAYREGAEYGDSGQTETAHGAIFIDVYNSDFLANTWVEIPLPPGTETDYIELMTESGAEFYEVEILTAGSQPTPVPELNWGQIKRG